MENTLENKEKFFTQYWRQYIAKRNGEDNIHRIDQWLLGDVLGFYNYYIELTSLSQITNEDSDNLGWRDANDFMAWSTLYNDWTGKLEEFQHLQSKGYALPFQGVSVETLVEWGWIKLKEK